MSQLTDFPDIDIANIDMMAPSATMKSSPKKRQTLSTETVLIGILFSMVASFVIGGLYQLDNKINSALNKEERSFQWLVFVHGEPLEIDDAGRSLGQYPHVTSIRYLSPQDAFGNIASTLGITKESEGIDVNTLPAVWQVGWDFASPALLQADDVASDMKRIKGVTDVAFDRNKIVRILDLMVFQKILRTSLGLLMLAGLLWGLYSIGRFFYLSAFKGLNTRDFIQTVFLDAAGWALGFLGLVRIIGQIPWTFALGGLLVGVFHYLINVSKLPRHASIFLPS